MRFTGAAGFTGRARSVFRVTRGAVLIAVVRSS
jgi:hypothetical protein